MVIKIVVNLMSCLLILFLPDLPTNSGAFHCLNIEGAFKIYPKAPQTAVSTVIYSTAKLDDVRLPFYKVLTDILQAL
ncbi:uncharacterized protein OCT59_010641 [Rhizophagus irregularis]|uniref:uncharacterized protein n=1 Tax=Rhizophagus irregularis TaxID=588596 RepID=UPI003322C2A8|nr:hypothetical protein OCT59_010641 [Rhizophagus irregularis]